MAFSICITAERFDEAACEEPAVKGVIEIGTFTEELLVSLAVWSPADYVRQWETGLKRISSADKSCLITSMRDLAVSDFINWWMLYRVGDDVVFQNQVLLATEVENSMIGDAIYGLIPVRETHTDDGQKISEWVVPLRDIDAFLSKR